MRAGVRDQARFSAFRHRAQESDAEWNARVQNRSGQPA